MNMTQMEKVWSPLLSLLMASCEAFKKKDSAAQNAANEGVQREIAARTGLARDVEARRRPVPRPDASRRIPRQHERRQRGRSGRARRRARIGRYRRRGARSGLQVGTVE